MSSPAPATGVVATVNQITSQVTSFAPAVITGVQAAEQSSASGQNKKAAVLAGIQAGAAAGEAIPIPQVAAISALVDLVVSIFNGLGLFQHKSTPATTTTAS